MQTVAADAINSRNKKVVNCKQIHQENFRKTSGKKKYYSQKSKTVAADAVNSKNKQKSSQLQIKSSRKFQENKWKEISTTVKNANSHSWCSKFKEQTKKSITNKFFGKIPVQHKAKNEEKRITDTIGENQRKIHSTGKYGRKG